MLRNLGHVCLLFYALENRKIKNNKNAKNMFNKGSSFCFYCFLCYQNGYFYITKKKCCFPYFFTILRTKKKGNNYSLCFIPPVLTFPYMWFLIRNEIKWKPFFFACFTISKPLFYFEIIFFFFGMGLWESFLFLIYVLWMGFKHFYSIKRFLFSNFSHLDAKKTREK